MANTTKRTRVFISYSHKDTAYLTRLHAHLAYYERSNVVDCWDDTKLRAGDDWDQRIAEAIEHARVCVLLVSADYLASAYVANKEIPAMLARARNDGALILQVILSPCAFERTELREFQAVNDVARPLSKMNRHYREETWAKIAQHVADSFPEPPPLATTVAASPARTSPRARAKGQMLKAQLAPPLEDDRLTVASELIERGAYAEAEELLGRQVLRTPEDFRAWFLYAVARSNKERHHGVRQALMKAFDLDFRRFTSLNTILVTDDDDTTRLLFSMMIEDMFPGYAVKTASDGVECLTYLTGNADPVVVVLDYMMPNMDGLKVLQMLAAGSKRYPVIFTSAHDFTAATIAAGSGYPIERISFLPKPFSVEDVENAVRNALDRNG